MMNKYEPDMISPLTAHSVSFLAALGFEYKLKEGGDTWLDDKFSVWDGGKWNEWTRRDFYRLAKKRCEVPKFKEKIKYSVIEHKNWFDSLENIS